MIQLATAVLSIVLSWALEPGYAQSTNATCSKSDTNSWIFNSAEESPCLVWSKLQSLCLSQDQYINVPPLLDASYAYNPPSKPGDICQCNVVAYNLMAACTYCQYSDKAVWLSEDQFKSQCTAYNNTSFSFAETVLPIPGFAFNTWNGGSWDPSKASAAATVTIAPTIAPTTLSRSFSGVTPSSTATNTSNPPGPSTSLNQDQGNQPSAAAKYGPIIGGIVGGILLLLLLLAIYFRWWRNRMNRQNQGIDRHTVYNNDTWFGGDPPNGQSRGILQEGSPRDYYQHSNQQTRQKGISFLNLLPTIHKSKQQQTERTKSTFSEGAFADPRPAPDPLRYITTSERLKERPESDDSIESGLPDLSHLPPRNYNNNNSKQPNWMVESPRSFVSMGGSSSNNSTDSRTRLNTQNNHNHGRDIRDSFGPDYTPVRRSRLLYPISKNNNNNQHHQPSIDFSAAAEVPSPNILRGSIEALSPGPLHEPPRSRKSRKKSKKKNKNQDIEEQLEMDGNRDTLQTLPSLYEPSVGAVRYDARAGPTTPMSPESRYTRADTDIGTALGSGTRMRWSEMGRHSIPEVPRVVSKHY